jgi:hypothetical protein
MSSNPAQVEMYSDTTLCEKVCQLFAVGRWFSPHGIQSVKTHNRTTQKTRHNVF